MNVRSKVCTYTYSVVMAIATPNDNGGYEYELVNTPPDRLICKICHLPSRDPYLSVCCGHVFCKSCLDNVKKAAAITNACPVCRDEEFVTFPNKQADREIRSLRIFCTNKEKGCEWEGELNDINNHQGNSNMDGCQFEEINCFNECGKKIQRRYMTGHVKSRCPRRKVNCQYCHDTGEHQFIEGQHKEECPKLPLPCPNKCEVGNVLREDMEAHRKECPLEIIQCEYYSVGCEVRMARKDKEKHIYKKENIEEHLMMTNYELTNTKAQLAAALKQMTSLTAILMNAQLGPNTAASHANIRSVHLDSKAEIFKCGNQTCPVTIKMSEYSVKRRDAIEWYSDPFYTHNKGYKMCLNIFAAGSDGESTHLSVYLHLMKGPYDDELTWPLTEELEIKLLNQINDSEHDSGTITYNDDIPDCYTERVTNSIKSECGWGWPEYASNEDLNEITPTCQFLKDDCLFFQVTKH